MNSNSHSVHTGGRSGGGGGEKPPPDGWWRRLLLHAVSMSQLDRALQKLHEGMEEEAHLFLIYCSMPPGGMEEEEMVATVNADIQITNLL